MSAFQYGAHPKTVFNFIAWTLAIVERNGTGIKLSTFVDVFRVKFNHHKTLCVHYRVRSHGDSLSFHACTLTRWKVNGWWGCNLRELCGNSVFAWQSVWSRIFYKDKGLIFVEYRKDNLDVYLHLKRCMKFQRVKRIVGEFCCGNGKSFWIKRKIDFL